MLKRTVLAILVAISFTVLIGPNLFAAEPTDVPSMQPRQSLAAQSAEIIGKVVDQDGKPVVGTRLKAHVVRETKVFGHIRTTTDADGHWKAARLDVPMLLVAKSSDGKFAASMRVEPDKSEIRLELAPAAEAHGTLGNHLGAPVADQKLSYAVRVPDDETKPNSPWVNAFGGTVTTNAKGEFTLTGLVPNLSYNLNLPVGTGFRLLGVVEPKNSHSLELADLRLPAPAPTLAEKTIQFFNKRNDFANVIDDSQKFAGPQALRVLLIVGDPRSEAARSYVKLREDRPHDFSLFELLDDYEQLQVSTDDAASMEVLKSKFGLDAEPLKPLSLVVLNNDGTVRATKKLPLESSVDRKVLSKELSEFTAANALPRPDANQLLASALDRARQEGKCVLLDESGTYCGWCRVLSRFFDRHPDIFEAYFVPVRMDRARFAHGKEVMQQYRTTEGGIPWCAFIDANGKKLGDWDTADGNMGYPTLPKEFDHLERILNLAAPKITAEQVAAMRADLEQEGEKYEQH